MGECQDLCSGDMALTGVQRMYWKDPERRKGGRWEASAVLVEVCDLVHGGGRDRRRSRQIRGIIWR